MGAIVAPVVTRLTRGQSGAFEGVQVRCLPRIHSANQVQHACVWCSSVFLEGIQGFWIITQNPFAILPADCFSIFEYSNRVQNQSAKEYISPGDLIQEHIMPMIQQTETLLGTAMIMMPVYLFRCSSF